MEILKTKYEKECVDFQNKECTSGIDLLKKSIYNIFPLAKEQRPQNFVDTQNSILEDIRNIERLLDINAKAYDIIEDESLIEANIYEYRGLMIRYNYLIAKMKMMEKFSLSSK